MIRTQITNCRPKTAKQEINFDRAMINDGILIDDFVTTIYNV